MNRVGLAATPERVDCSRPLDEEDPPERNLVELELVWRAAKRRAPKAVPRTRPRNSARICTSGQSISAQSRPQHHAH